MSNQTLAQIAAGDRLVVLDVIGEPGVGSNGQSLRGRNVNSYPEGVLAFVRDSARYYMLKKNLPTDVVEDVSGNDNVIDSIGSSSVKGRWVALRQQCVVTLAGGESTNEVNQIGFDLSSGGNFHVSYATFAGTPGQLRAFITNDFTVTVQSHSLSDTSEVFVTFYQEPEGG